MPVRNEGDFIVRSLGAALKQDYTAGDLEVIVADGMSTDRTREIVRTFQTDFPNLKLIDNPGLIVPTGLNAAITQARGEVIVRVDGHTIIEPDYVRRCVAALQRSGADNVGGRMRAVSDGRFGRAVALATSSRFGVGGARFHYSMKEEWVDTVYMGAWPRAVFRRTGLFDEEQVRNQDDEFNYRLLEHGGRILLCPQIKSAYYNRSSARSLWRQYYQYGFWKVRVMQKHPRQMRWRQFAPPAFVLALILATAPALFTTVWPLAAVIALYLLGNFVASLLAARQGGWVLLPTLPAVFAILHVAYGSGFWVGFFKFRKNWVGRSRPPVLTDVQT